MLKAESMRPKADASKGGDSCGDGALHECFLRDIGSDELCGPTGVCYRIGSCLAGMFDSFSDNDLSTFGSDKQGSRPPDS